MDSNKQMADLLFKNITKTPDDYEQMYPKRNLEEGAVVTRFAPSPTGFLHFGGLGTAILHPKRARPDLSFTAWHTELTRGICRQTNTYQS